MKKAFLFVMSLMLLTSCSEKDKLPDNLWGNWVVNRIDSVIVVAGMTPDDGYTMIRRFNDVGFLTLNQDSTGTLAIPNEKITCGVTGFNWILDREKSIRIETHGVPNVLPITLAWYEYYDKQTAVLFWPALCGYSGIIGVDSYYMFYLSK